MNDWISTIYHADFLGKLLTVVRSGEFPRARYSIRGWCGNHEHKHPGNAQASGIAISVDMAMRICETSVIQDQAKERGIEVPSIIELSAEWEVRRYRKLLENGGRCFVGRTFRRPGWHLLVLLDEERIVSDDIYPSPEEAMSAAEALALLHFPRLIH